MGDFIARDFKEAYVRMKERALEAEQRLAQLEHWAAVAVHEYPVASGIYVDSDGQEGYGSLKALRLFLGIVVKSAPQIRTSQLAERQPNGDAAGCGAGTAVGSPPHD